MAMVDHETDKYEGVTLRNLIKNSCDTNADDEFIERFVRSFKLGLAQMELATATPFYSFQTDKGMDNHPIERLGGSAILLEEKHVNHATAIAIYRLFKTRGWDVRVYTQRVGTDVGPNEKTQVIVVYKPLLDQM